MLKAFGIVLSLHNILALDNTCVMTETTGCIMGSPYDFATQFVCGAMQAGNVPPIYDLATQGCCNQGQPYSKELEFCCANTLYPLGAGQCVRWLRSETEKYPECYECSVNPNRALSYLDALGVSDSSVPVATAGDEEEHLEIEAGTNKAALAVVESLRQQEEALESELETKENESELDEEQEHRQLATWPTSNPFDTIENGPSPTPCLEMTDKIGCFNTYEYVFVTHYPCYNLLLTWSVYGCCDGIPYRHQSQTCCFLDGEYVVKNANTWCTCQSYECAPSAAPTKKPVSKKPTVAPTRRPSQGPTITFYPTDGPTRRPTNNPTMTFRPTPVTKTASIDDDEFHVEYVYGGAGLFVVGLAAFMYLQGRATRLIKERHTIVQEIEENT
jgi:hypothetical protein